ncbi:hypothetical protein KKH43_00545 [Patescibacteria group bacterium]|nr:hypothetical protein [Patescibacteria group bacterium]
MERKTRQVTLLLDEETMRLLEVNFALGPHELKPFLNQFLPSALLIYKDVLNGRHPSKDAKDIFLELFKAQRRLVDASAFLGIEARLTKGFETLTEELGVREQRILNAYLTLSLRLGDLPGLMLDQHYELQSPTEPEIPTIGGSQSKKPKDDNPEVRIREGPGESAEELLEEKQQEEEPLVAALSESSIHEPESAVSSVASDSRSEQDHVRSVGIMIVVLLACITLLIGLAVYVSDASDLDAGPLIKGATAAPKD